MVDEYTESDYKIAKKVIKLNKEIDGLKTKLENSEKSAHDIHADL
jgi:hypothetical protein